MPVDKSVLFLLILTRTGKKQKQFKARPPASSSIKVMASVLLAGGNNRGN